MVDFTQGTNFYRIFAVTLRTVMGYHSMKSRKLWLFLLAWASASGLATPLRAQSNPPFQNPALDSNCYFPQIGDPSEMDTIVGSVPNQDLGGSVLINLGPKPDGSFGNMFISNI